MRSSLIQICEFEQLFGKNELSRAEQGTALAFFAISERTDSRRLVARLLGGGMGGRKAPVP